MGFFQNVFNGAKSGGLAAVGQEGNSLAEKASSAVSNFFSNINLPTLETDANVKADKSVFILVAVVGAAAYFIFRK